MRREEAKAASPKLPKSSTPHLTDLAAPQVAHVVVADVTDDSVSNREKAACEDREGRTFSASCKCTFLTLAALYISGSSPFSVVVLPSRGRRGRRQQIFSSWQIIAG